MDPLRLKVNLTTAFTLPLLYDKGLKHSDILTETFINAYIADLGEPEQDNKLLVRYATIVNLPEWTNNFKLYASKDDAIMVTYEVPDDQIENYQKILIGDYSKLSLSYKEMVLNFWEANEDTLIHGVLYKTGQEIKDFVLAVSDTDLDMVSDDTEYWRPPNLKQEIFGMTEDD